MRIYTEEHVREAIELARYTHLEGRAYTQTEEYDYSYDEVVDLLTPIELPSDEELSEEPVDLFLGDPKSINNILKYKAFQRGAKWMRDKIQGGNK